MFILYFKLSFQTPMLFRLLRSLICSIHPRAHSLLYQVGFRSNPASCPRHSRFIAAAHSCCFVQGFPPWPPTLTHPQPSAHPAITVRSSHPQNIHPVNFRYSRWSSFHTAGCRMDSSDWDRQPLNKRRKSGDEKRRKETKEVYGAEGGAKVTGVKTKEGKSKREQYLKDKIWKRGEIRAEKPVSTENIGDKERTKTGYEDNPSKDGTARTPNQQSAPAGSGIQIHTFRPEQDPSAVPKSNPWFRGKGGPAGPQRNTPGPAEPLKHGALQRHWEICSSELQPPRGNTEFDFSVMSYNILSQELLKDNSYLYHHCPPGVLLWDYRLPTLLTEIQQHNADILCLQEVQEDHYENQIKPALQALGYQCEFKKRTGRKPDGCAIAFKTSRFSLLSSNPVEYFRPGDALLDRDNVGLVVLLQPNIGPGQPEASSFICVANTHLLFNPRRGDIKLAQLAILLAEISRLSGLPDGSSSPVVLCGDFNSVPWSPLYSFLTRGSLWYQELTIGTVSGQEAVSRGQRLLPFPIWSPSLGINHRCRYESTPTAKSSPPSPKALSEERARALTRHNQETGGRIEHSLKLQSSYRHHLAPDGRPEITTCHSRTALTVDYILYSPASVPGGCGLQLLGRLSLVGQSEMEEVHGLPNPRHPSDHLPLLASFRLCCGPGSARRHRAASETR
ncbi:protein angel homolog 2 [Cololabis saira]|uniref:protein angel homolog 2 n=1 Tax=Cololabis saira TaxID=129043 RepID=UPI002AD31AD5|nr:protein angel homolog 2 [Cololabis saira]